MLAGLKMSTADYVGIIDADLQHSPDLIPDMRILRADCYFYVWHISFHPLFASVARACLKNHFRKLGLAAHEKRFSDTLIISDFVDQL